MSVRERGALITWTTGELSGPPVLLLHDRYGDHGDNDALGRHLAGTHRVVSARSARTQMESGHVKGYYWFLGPHGHPELSTLGDGLSHLERLIIGLNRETGCRVAIAGIGEGGSIALLMGLLWPEIVAGVASIDGPLAANIADLPLSFVPAAGLPVLLAERRSTLSSSIAGLADRGATVSCAPADDEAVSGWIRGLQA